MSIERRLKLLEQTGGEECPTCSGLFVVIVSGQFSRATRHGEPLSEAEYQRYVSENGPVCPVCGERPVDIKVP